MNKEIKAYAKERGVKLYEVAERLGIQPSQFSVAYMRYEQPRDVNDRIKKLIDEIKGERK